MKFIRTLQFPLTAAAVFAASLALGAFAMATLDAPADSEAAHAAHAAWISDADTVAEQVQEADLVVRVQAVDRAQPRALWSPAPAQAKNAPGTFVFTDTEVEILEVYKGEATAGDRVWVLQTGGETTDLRGQAAQLVVAEDPIYRLGDEMVLFLVDISDDKVHAQGRDLFRTVNPAGRYQVEGGLVTRVDLGAGAVVESDLPTLESTISSSLEAF